MTSVAVLGSTGSIGTQTLDVIRAESGRFEIVALAAGRSVEAVVEQVREFGAKLVVMADETSADGVRSGVGSDVRVHHGPAALADAAREADIVINGIVGFAGLPVTLAALESGRRLALANKESLIAAGPVVQRAPRHTGCRAAPGRLRALCVAPMPALQRGVGKLRAA